MKPPLDWRLFLNPGVILGAMILAGILTTITMGAIGFVPASSGDLEIAPADLTLIPAPTSTPAPSATPTMDPFATPTPVTGQIVIGGYVQISGTDGDPLRLRAGPGLNTEPLFLGFDSEVFQVRDGPREADGYTWWYLVAPYDETRAGWAAADFLAVVPSP
jgi:hypothetical protein